MNMYHPRNGEVSNIAICAALLMLLFTGAVLESATLQVNSTADENGSTPPNGTCTLREAVLAANGNVAVDGCPAGEAAPVVDQILLPAGVYTLSIPGGGAAGGSLDLLEDVEILGSDQIDTVIEQEEWRKTFEIPAAVTVLIEGLTVYGGATTYDPGSIFNSGDLTLRECRIEGAYGDALYNAAGGQATVERCVFHSNQQDAIANYGHAEVFDSIFTHNGSEGITTHGTLQVQRSTLSHNGKGITCPGTMQVLNSTISYNQPWGGVAVTLNGTALISNSTIAYNTASYGSGILVNSTNTVQLQNTIIADNPGGNCMILAGTLITTGGNIESPGNSCFFNDPMDQVNVASTDLALGPLALYGGLTPLHGLLPGSVAIDTGVASGPAVDCPPDDQRGLPRDDGLCDCGAAEVQPGEDMGLIFADGLESGDCTEWSFTIGESP